VSTNISEHNIYIGLVYGFMLIELGQCVYVSFIGTYIQKSNATDVFMNDVMQAQI